MLRLLLIEDSESHTELIVQHLRGAGYPLVFERVRDVPGLRDALANLPWNLLIGSYKMPGAATTSALNALRETGLDIPFLVISGTAGEELAVAMIKAGAHEYLMNHDLARLARVVERELCDAQTRADERTQQTFQDREEQLALAIESTEMGIFDYDFATGTCFYSDLAKRHLQIRAGAQQTVWTFLESLHPADRPRIEAALKTALMPGGAGRYAEEHRTKTEANAEDRWVSAWGRVLYNGRGEASHFLGTVRDITDTKNAERKLQLQLKLTACITEQSQDCILLTDREGGTLFANREAERVFGFSFAEFTGRSPHELLHRNCAECPLSRYVACDEIRRDYEGVVYHKDGSLIDVAFSCVPLELEGTRIGTVLTFRDITQRKRTERALSRSDERFRGLFEADVIGIVVGDGERFLEANDCFLRMIGYTREEFFTTVKSWRAITPAAFLEVSERAIFSVFNAGRHPPFEKEYIRKDGTTIPVLFAPALLNGPPGPRSLGLVVDLTERKNLENQFRQAQKLETIGLLAGGVAHDFNNLLTVIMGYTNVVLNRMHRESPFRDAVEQISASARRAAGLTGQLLAFSRNHPCAPKILDLNLLIVDIETMLRRLIGEHIEVIVLPAAEKSLIHADEVLVEQVIINLALNARDSMPDGGEIHVETSRITLSGEFAAASFSVPPGIYVSLTVTDTGAGMTPEVQARAFEPFFTTKDPGLGTGLGLSTVYGIVKQSEGSITIHSGPGIGTAIRVLFPAAGAGDAGEVGAVDEEPAGGTETVLLVEDDDAVRKYVREILDAHGYRVLDAANGADAIEIAGRYGGSIHALLTDVVLPGMNGLEVIRRFHALRPAAAMLRMSGYPERFGGDAADGGGWLQKPFTEKALLIALRDALDTRAAEMVE